VPLRSELVMYRDDVYKAIINLPVRLLHQIQHPYPQCLLEST
jgi:hypothetical protein